jgi:hypothetical protein
MKKIIVLILAFICVVTVAFIGCEKKKEAPQPVAQPAVIPPPSPAPEIPAPPPAPEKPAKK